ncbi:MAG TPA: N-acetyltransferase, partial [Chloroflexi bacterium]|nr:N-acetyltransferase [Chloroflexota bacterium]
MLDRVEEESSPCYTETMDEKNVGLYEHLGFRVMEKSAIPDTGLTTWALLRDAR